jgi:multidrug efflux pump subunit AcrA (membrane-fusion protein)
MKSIRERRKQNSMARQPAEQQSKQPEQQYRNRVLDLSEYSDDDFFEEQAHYRRGIFGSARRRWIVSIILVLLVAAIGSGAFFVIQNNHTTPVSYQSQPVIRGNLTLTVSATGPIQANTYDANFSASGKVSAINVKVGDTVKKDQVLAKLSRADGSTVNLQAPHGGIVTAINGSVGDSINASTAASGSNSFIQITDLSSLHIQANVNEADISRVAVGDEVQFTVSAYSNLVFSGKISAISPIGQTSSSVVTYPVTVNVDMHHLQGATLLPNMTASVTITTASRTNVLLIPAKAVSFARQAAMQGIITPNQQFNALAQARQLMASNKNPKNQLTPAFVLERSNNQWVAVPVVLGLTDGSNYELVAGNINAGDSLIVSMQGNSSSPSSSPTPGGGLQPSGGPPSGGPSGGLTAP